MSDLMKILRDLVERFHRAQELNYLYDAAIDSTSVGFILTDERGIIRKLNPGAAALFGVSAADLIGSETIFHLLECTLGDDGERPNAKRINQLLISEGSVRKQRVLVRREDGKVAREIPALLTVNLIPVPNTEASAPNMRTLGFVAIIEDNSEVENLTVTDGLTGLFNRRYFDRKLAEEYERMLRSRGKDTGSLALLFGDVDKFHDFNEKHGHPMGDVALRAVAQVLKEGIRYYDAACRYGGEEFAVIMPACDLEGARHSAERIRERIAAIRFDDRGLSVTASIGIQCHAHSCGGIEALVTEADQAMYLAKEQGRNRVICFDGLSRALIAK